MFSFNSFIPEKPYPAYLYDIENQYKEWYDEDDYIKEDYCIKIKNLFGKI